MAIVHAMHSTRVYYFAFTFRFSFGEAATRAERARVKLLRPES